MQGLENFSVRLRFFFLAGPLERELIVIKTTFRLLIHPTESHIPQSFQIDGRVNGANLFMQSRYTINSTFIYHCKSCASKQEIHYLVGFSFPRYVQLDHGSNQITHTRSLIFFKYLTRISQNFHNCNSTTVPLLFTWNRFSFLELYDLSFRFLLHLQQHVFSQP